MRPLVSPVTPVGGGGLQAEVDRLSAALAAREKTLAVLLRRTQEHQRSQSTAYASLVNNAALQRVVERKTQELAEQNQRLEQAHAALRLAQAELVEGQKLESIGRLAAGIAHEINTPIQFVNDSIHFIRDGLHDILALLETLQALRQSLVAGAPTADAVAAAYAAEDDADLPYLKEQLPKALERCLDGLGRVATIVRSMREFAHPDQKQMSAVNLNQAIQSTLIIARNEYKYVADLETDFGELPPITCIGGEINQAVLNIVVNAAHAIADVNKGTERRGCIWVRTRRQGDHVLIEIRDTGGGIPEEIRHRIFDPFFTTKEVGRGTGQGLAIARNVVVQKHGGTLTFETEPGIGTTFALCLPIDGPGHPPAGDTP